MKVRFEFEIEGDEIIQGAPSTSDENFRDCEEKTFLYQEPITKGYIIAHCYTGITKERKYASYIAFPLPANTKVQFDGPTDENPFDKFEDCLDKCADRMVNEVVGHLSTTLDTIKEWLQSSAESQSDGISEKTLLEALRIVTQSKTKEE